MKGEKGSLKNRLMEYNNRKKQQQRMKEAKTLEKQIKKQDNIRKKEKDGFITIQTVTKKGKNQLKKIFGFLFAFLENICTDSHKKDKKIDTLEQPNLQYTSRYEKNIDTYEQENELEERIKEQETKEQIEKQDILEEKIDESDKLIENDVTPEQMDEKVKKEIVSEQESEMVEKQDTLVYSEEDILGNELLENQSAKSDTVDEQKKITLLESEPKGSSLTDTIIELTNGINIVHNNLDTIIESDEDINDKRKDIIGLKEKIQNLKDLYQKSVNPEKEALKNLDEIKDIDPYNLRNSPKEMNELLQKCDNELSKIKKQNKDTDNFVLNKELERVKTVIEENLKEQKDEIDELKELFNRAEIKNKRSTLVTGIHNFLSKTINIGLSLLPITICKNKFVGMLGSTVILNNRLRSMRKIIRKENKNISYITYKNIANELRNQKLCIDKTKEVLEDSMHQLQNLKQEFIMEFYYDMDRYPEADDIMTEFSSIEYQITSKNNELEEMLQTIENVEERNKQKIKVMD